MLRRQAEVTRLGPALRRPARDTPVYCDRLGTSKGPSEALNGRIEHLRGSALGFRKLSNYIARALLDVGVVDDAVDHGRGDGLVAEDATSAGERQVRGQDQRGVFVAAGHELEEQVRCVLLEGQVADLVDDDLPVAPQPGQLLG